MEFIHAIPCLMIHRPQDKEREECIELFENHLQRKIQRVDGFDGKEFIEKGFPTKHPREKTPTSPGNIGCTLSHIFILESILKSNHEYVLILEDDVEYISDFSEFVKASFTLPHWDILFLGVNELVDSTETENPMIHRVSRFWGTHAVILTRVAAAHICKEFKASVENGYALPADWLYSKTLKQSGLIAYCPKNPRAFVQQKEGLFSTCTGNLRNYR